MPLNVGETVVVQEVWRGRVWAARPMTVVEDAGEAVVLWFPRGTRWRAPTNDPARAWHEDRGERLAACAASGEWSFRDGEWDVSTLWFMRERDWHAVWVSWLPDGTHWGWYVNLQTPYRRTALGFETMDLMLDVVIEPDRSWRWKDEDELEACVRAGAFDVALVERVRDEGLHVVLRVERGEPPFCEPWGEWRPDPCWPKPELPAGWNEVRP
jgi:hypothetical protein